MKTHEEIQKEIREEWFKDHKATLETHGDITVLDWKRPGSNFYYCRYVFDGHRVYISGDIGEAVFLLTWKAGIDAFNKISVHYFH